jgi:hypothetical protein
MDEAEKARTEAMFAKDDLAKAKFEAQLRAHREKKLHVWRLARIEASRVERREDTVANKKSGLVGLQIKTALMRARRFIKVFD